jgi:hypothetical protein
MSQELYRGIILSECKPTILINIESNRDFDSSLAQTVRNTTSTAEDV